MSTADTITRMYNEIIALSLQYQIKDDALITIDMYLHDEQISKKVRRLTKELGMYLIRAKKENVSIPYIEAFYKKMQ